MVTQRAGEIVLDEKRYKLRFPRQWQKQEAVVAARKIGSGDRQYSDYDLYSVKAWTTWHLGRGQEYFEIDGRYYDSWNCETRIRGQLALGPHIFPTSVGGNSLYYESGTQGSVAIGQDNPTGLDYYAYTESFNTPSGGFTADSALFHLKRWNTPGSDITVSLCSDNGGVPGTVLKSATVQSTTIPTNNYAWIEFDWTGTQALTGSTTYWLVVSVASLTSSAHYKIAADIAHGYGGACKFSTATPWSWQDCSSDYDLWFRLVGAEGELNGKPVRFAYFNDNGTKKLFVLAGSKVYYWDATNNYWVDDTAGLSGTGTDMVVWNNCLVVAQGTAGNMRRKGATHPTAAWAWADFTPAAQAYRLGIGIVPAGEAAGKWALIKTGPTSGTDRHIVQCVPPGYTAWYNFAGQEKTVIVGDSCSDITWIGEYQGSIWICKEDGVYEIGKDGIPYMKFPFYTQKSSTNFWGASVWHRNELILPAIFGLWSFDGSTLKNIGPGISMGERGYIIGSPGEHVGLPADRQGVIIDTLPTVNALYAAIDAGSSGSRYSSIMLWNQYGWHEVARGDTINKQIRTLGYTAAGEPEEEPRLWWGFGNNIFYAVIPDRTDNPYHYTEFKFENQGWVELGWFDADLKAVDKDWREITVEAEGVTAGQYVDIIYMLDDDTSWTFLGRIDNGDAGTAIVNNQATLSFPAATYGKRINLRTYLVTDDPDESPRVTGIILKYWEVPDPVYGWNLILQLTDLDRTWRQQQTDFLATFEKKEPVTLVDPYGASHTVRLRRPVETILATETGEPIGCTISAWAYEA